SSLENIVSLITIAPAVDRLDLTKFSQPQDIPRLVVQGIDDDTVNPNSVIDFNNKSIKTDLTLFKMKKFGHYFNVKL
ncbi:alpha/beta hydrolase, partial [Francisella tularensis subsp. holarctica]|nr:alpha/beta hydrolase [Francisella tularensis subsp. holarctica]